MGLGDVVEGEASIDDRPQHAGGEQRQHLGGEAAARPRSSPPAAGRAAPCRSRDPLRQQRADVDGRRCRRRADRPGRSCRAAARPSRLRSTSSPPTTSSTTSTPSTPRPASVVTQRASQSAGDRSSTTSAPSSAQRWALPAEHVTATLAPIALAIWIAAVPTPEAPAWTSAHRPLVRPPCTTRASHAVRKTSGTAAASRRSSPGGDGHRLAGVGDDELGVAATALDPHHGVADRPVRDPFAAARRRCRRTRGPGSPDRAGRRGSL